MATITKVCATLLSAAALLSFAPAANAGLVALYTYDNALNLGLDSSGNGNNLVSLNSTVGSAAGVYGGAANFSGGNALVSTSGTLAGLPIGGSSYTITSWINPNSAGGNGAGGIVGWGNYGATNQTNAFRMEGNSSLHNYWWDNDLSGGASGDLTDRFRRQRLALRRRHLRRHHAHQLDLHRWRAGRFALWLQPECASGEFRRRPHGGQ